MPKLPQVGYHNSQDVVRNPVSRVDTKFAYTFENLFHPFVGELIAKLNQESLPAMMDASRPSTIPSASISTQSFVTSAGLSESVVFIEGGPAIWLQPMREMHRRVKGMTLW